MDDFIKLVEWLGIDATHIINKYSNISILVVVLVLCVIQSSKSIKCRPWDYIFYKVGKGINAEIKQDINDLQTHAQAVADEVRTLQCDYDAYKASVMRNRILCFSDGLTAKSCHSRELWGEILDDITRYEQYCASHPEYINNKARLTIDHIKDTYKDCLDTNNFLR